jgi:hypothetical protein
MLQLLMVLFVLLADSVSPPECLQGVVAGHLEETTQRHRSERGSADLLYGRLAV